MHFRPFAPWIFGLMLVWSPGVQAGLTLQISSTTLTSPVEDTMVYPEIYVVEKTATQPEGILSFDMGMRLRGGAAGGVRYFPDFPSFPVVKELFPVDHPYVFANTSDRFTGLKPVRPVFPRRASDYYGPDYLFVAAIAENNASTQVEVGDGLLRLPIIVPAGTPAGRYELTFEEVSTVFERVGSGGVAIPLTRLPGEIVIVPEPALTVPIGVSVVGSLACRRRRS